MSLLYLSPIFHRQGNLAAELRELSLGYLASLCKLHVRRLGTSTRKCALISLSHVPHARLLSQQQSANASPLIRRKRLQQHDHDASVGIIM